MRHRSSILIALAALTTMNAHARGLLDDRLQVHGFASQAAVRSSANQYFGDSTDTSYDFTEIGLNASFRIDSGILLSGQILSRRAGEMYDGSPSLDYALADVSLISSAEGRTGLRLGRIKNPLGLYNETRDVPFTRPGIFLPQSVYYDKIRNMLLSSDGVMLYGDHYGDWGNLSLILGGGWALVDENVEWAYLGNDFPGTLKAQEPAWIANLSYSSTSEHIKLGLSGATCTLDYHPGTWSPLDEGSIHYLYWIASFQYNARNWSISSEYSRTPLEWRGFGPFFVFDKETIEGYYLQAAYQIRPNIEFMMRYEESFADRRDRDGSHSSALTGGYTPSFDFYSKIWTAGLRWDIVSNLMLRLEYQRHRGTFALSIRENPFPWDLEKDWDVLAASISLRF